ncbi:MAG TPA: PQQ-binding-like beta-propeller repeat protein [Gemmataceae bacterium]|nr:PQQ-binding-like beta-propeller repeat protein [Gemmataceae bacterium]
MKNAILLTGMLLGSALLLGADNVSAQDWPQWRGPNRDNKVTDFKAPAKWPTALTKKWRVKVGQGESSPLLVGDKVYVFGRQGNEEITVCLDAATGKEIWRDKYASNPKYSGDKQHAGPRSTPAVAEGKIVTLGVDGEVSCLDLASGKMHWRKKSGSVPMFHTASSPLIVDGMCIVYAGSLTAFDLAKGTIKWQAKSVTADQASPTLMTVDGVKQIVAQVGAKSLVGVDVADGKVLWTAAYTGNSMQTPVVDGQVVYCSGPGGTVAVKVEKKGDKFNADQLWKQKAPAASKYNTPVLSGGVVKDGLLFGLSGGGSTTMFCMDAKTGKQLWTDNDRRGECGHILSAGAVLIYVGSDGKLVVFEPSATGFKSLASYTVDDNTGINGPWSCPILTGNRIFVKDNAGSLTLWTIE